MNINFFENLPPDVFNNIFNCLDLKDRFICRMVSKVWLARIPIPPVRDTALNDFFSRVSNLLTYNTHKAAQEHKDPHCFMMLLKVVETVGQLTAPNLTRALNKNARALLDLLQTLNNVQLLTARTFNALLSFHPSPLKKAVDGMIESEILTEELFEIVASSRYPEEILTYYILPLHRSGILTPDSMAQASAFSEQKKLTRIFCILELQKILTEPNRKLAIDHPDPNRLVPEITVLVDAGILTDSLFKLATSRENPTEFGKAIKAIHEAGVNLEENLSLIHQAKEPYNLVQIVLRLHKKEWWTEENRNLAANISQKSWAVNILDLLEQATIVSEQNFKCVAKHDDLNRLLVVMEQISKVNKITEEYFNELVNCKNLSDFIYGLQVSESCKLLTKTTLDAIFAHPKKFELANAICILKRKNLLTKQIWLLVLNHSSPAVFTLLALMKCDDLYTDQLAAIVARHSNPVGLLSIYCNLQYGKILTKETLLASALHENFNHFLFIISHVPLYSVLMKDTFDVIILHPNLEELAKAVSILMHNPYHLKKAILHPHPMQYVESSRPFV